MKKAEEKEIIEKEPDYRQYEALKLHEGYHIRNKQSHLFLPGLKAYLTYYSYCPSYT